MRKIRVLRTQDEEESLLDELAACDHCRVVDFVNAHAMNGAAANPEFCEAIEQTDLVVPKTRYSGFTGTNLDLLLRERNIRTLIVTGIASNVCVESTIRDALFREYFCVFVHDATQESGPAFIQDAVIYNVETFLGWVSSTDGRAPF